MLIRDAIKQRMIELDIDHCAAVQIQGDPTPIISVDSPRMNEELGDRDFMLLGSITNATQADIDRGLVRTQGSHVCYSGCEELEGD